MMKSIFLENKDVLFKKEFLYSPIISATINVVTGEQAEQIFAKIFLLPLPERVYCNNFVRRMNVSK